MVSGMTEGPRKTRRARKLDLFGSRRSLIHFVAKGFEFPGHTISFFEPAHLFCKRHFGPALELFALVAFECGRQPRDFGFEVQSFLASADSKTPQIIQVSRTASFLLQ